MGKFVITEEEKKHIIKLYEQPQEDIFIKKGYEIVKPNNAQKNIILQLKNKYDFDDAKVYQRKDILLLSDGKQVYFLIAPNGVIVNHVYNIGDEVIQNKF